MRKLSIFLVVMGMVFGLTGIVGAGLDSGLSDIYSSAPLPFQDTGVNAKAPFRILSDSERAVLDAPTLGLAIRGTTVLVSWTEIPDATGYKLSYAPYPDAGNIQSIDVGNKTGISAILSEGAAYYLAVQAYNSSGYSGYSNITHFVLSSSDSVYDYAQDIIMGYVDGDVNFLATRFSRDFLNNGMDYNCIYSLEQYLFSLYSYDMTYYIHKVTEYTQSDKTLATINKTSSYIWYSDFGEIFTSTSTEDIILVLEDGKWKRYGNQMGYQSPSVYDMVSCVTVENEAPVGTKTAFTQADKTISIFSNLLNLGNGFTVSIKWYRPDGALAFNSEFVNDWGEYPLCARDAGYFWDELTILDDSALWNANQGQWRVDLFVDDVLVGQTNFEYSQN